jgi:hypothetical protein
MTNNFLPKPKTYQERVPRLLLEAIALPPVFLPHLRRLRIPHVPKSNFAFFLVEPVDVDFFLVLGRTN